jgi:hypothetical protein
MNSKCLPFFLLSLLIFSGANSHLRADDNFLTEGSPGERSGDGTQTECIIVDPVPDVPIAVDPRPYWFSNSVIGSYSTTTVTGISGGVTFGSYLDSSGMTEGFSFDGSNFTTIDHPDASDFSEVRGYSGGTYAGNFTGSNGVIHGFLFDGTNYTTIDEPNAIGCTSITGFEGISYVGNYYDANWTSKGFVFDGTNYSTLLEPDAVDGTVYVNGVSGGIIFGNYSDTNYVTHGFLYDGTSYTTIDVPNANGYTAITGVDGNSYVGNYYDTNWAVHGFIFDGTNYSTIDADTNSITIGSENPVTSPTTSTWVTGISGVSFVGNYYDVNGSTHGFLYDGTNYAPIDEPNAGGIPIYSYSYNSYPYMMCDRVVIAHTTEVLLKPSKAHTKAFKPKPQRIRVKVTKPAINRGGVNPTVRVVASSPAGKVGFTSSSNAVISSSLPYWSKKSRVYISTANVTVTGSGKVKVTAIQLGNASFAPAKSVTLNIKTPKIKPPTPTPKSKAAPTPKGSSGKINNTLTNGGCQINPNPNDSIPGIPNPNSGTSVNTNPILN